MHTTLEHAHLRLSDGTQRLNGRKRDLSGSFFSLPFFSFFFLLYLYARSDPRTNGINRWCCLFTNRKRAQPGHGQSLCSSSSTETKSNPPLMAERAVVSNWSNPLRQSDWDSEKELAPKRRKRCTDSTRKVSAPKTWHDTTGIGRLDSPNKERAYWSGNERCLFLSFLLYWTKRISASRRTMVGFCTLGSFLLSAKSHRVSPSKLCRHVGKGEEEDIYLEPSPLPIHRYYIGRSTKEWTTTIENPHFALFMKDSVRPLYSMHSRTIICSISIGIVWCVTVRCPRLPVRIGGAWLGRPPTNIWLAISLLLNAQLIIYRGTHTHRTLYMRKRPPSGVFMNLFHKNRIGSRPPMRIRGEMIGVTNN